MISKTPISDLHHCIPVVDQDRLHMAHSFDGINPPFEKETKQEEAEHEDYEKRYKIGGPMRRGLRKKRLRGGGREMFGDSGACGRGCN